MNPYIAPFKDVFDTEAVSLLDGMLIVGGSVAMFTIIEIEEQCACGYAPCGPASDPVQGGFLSMAGSLTSPTA